MNFKEWLVLKESVQIMDRNELATLNVVQPNLIKEFHYQWEEGYSSYFIAPYQARKVGYVVISEKPSHVGITKTDPIEAGEGIDIAFINKLSQLISTKYQPVPYREGESDWIDVFKQTGTELPKQKPGEFATAQQPEFGTQQPAMQKLTPSISVSKASGSWSVYIQSSMPEYAIKSLLDMMKQAAKPLLENNLIEFYEIVNRMSGKREEIEYSESGKQVTQKRQDTYSSSVAYLKFLAYTMLKNNAQQMVMDRINGKGVKVSGGAQHPAVNVQPADNKIPLDELSEFVKDSYADDIILQFFIKTLKSNNDLYYEIMDAAAKQNTPAESLYYIDEFISEKTEKEIEGITEGMWGNVYNLLKNGEFISQFLPSQFGKFKSDVENAVNEFLENNKELDPYDIKQIKKLSEFIDIHQKDQIDKLHSDVQAEEQEKQRQRKETAEKQKYIIYDDTWKYLILTKQPIWEYIPGRYINYHNEVDLEHFIDSENIVDTEHIIHAAYEKAEEEAWERAEEKPSESYGEDKEEVNSDIEYEGDDFAEDRDLPDVEGLEDEEFFNLIKEKYYDEFVKWKIEKLREEEKEESWKYEPEADEEDVRKYMDEMAVEFAFEDMGLVTATNEEGNLIFELHSKFKDQFKPILKKTIELMMQAKDPEYDEPIIKVSSKISIDYRDGDGETLSAYDILRK